MESRIEKNKEKQLTIEEEEKKQRRKKVTKTILFILLIGFCLFSGSYLYITNISTKKVIVKEEIITDSELPNSFIGKKIIVFSDLHYGSTFFLDETKKIVNDINRRNPDLVFFTGDLIDENYKLSTKEAESLTKELKKIKATIGKYAVSGEEDSSSFQTIMNQSDFTLLNNDFDLAYSDDNHPILIVGLSSLSTDRNIDQAFRYFKEENHNANIFTITLLHEPDSIDEIKSTYKSNLILAGHSHNGQIHLPIIDKLLTFNGAETYYKEQYLLDNSKVYISSGLGTSNYPVRFGVHPSISFFRLRK